MPKPVYILCAESGSVDAKTNRMSHFNIIEKIAVTKARVPRQTKPMPGAPPLNSMQVVSVWMRTAQDTENQEFEYELDISLPHSQKKHTPGKGRFKFTKPLQRITVGIVGLLPFSRSGLMKIQCRIRKVGDRKWLRQEYPIIIEVVTPNDK